MAWLVCLHYQCDVIPGCGDTRPRIDLDKLPKADQWAGVCVAIKEQAVIRPREVAVTSTGKGGAAEGVGGWKEAEVVISKGVAAVVG